MTQAYIIYSDEKRNTSLKHLMVCWVATENGHVSDTQDNFNLP